MIADRKLCSAKSSAKPIAGSLRARRRRPRETQNPSDVKDGQRSDPRHLASPPGIDPRQLIACCRVQRCAASQAMIFGQTLA